MDAKFTTVVGQLSLNNGQWETQAENQVAVREPKSADAPGAACAEAALYMASAILCDACSRFCIARLMASASSPFRERSR